MNSLIKILAKSGLLKGDLDYHLVRASMVLIFVLFGYQKWFAYEAETLIPFISNGPLIFWLYPVFGVRGASWVLRPSHFLGNVCRLRGLRLRGLVGGCAALLLDEKHVVGQYQCARFRFGPAQAAAVETAQAAVFLHVGVV